MQASATGRGVYGKRDRAIVLFLLATGARASGLLGLTDADIDHGSRIVTLREKGGRVKRARLGRAAWAALKAWLAVRPVLPGGPVWTTQRRTPMDYATLSKLMQRLGECADVANCIPHRFRHTAATQYTMAHHDPMATKAFLGHARLDTTEAYLKSLGADHYLGLKLSTPDEWLG